MLEVAQTVMLVTLSWVGTVEIKKGMKHQTILISATFFGKAKTDYRDI